MVRQVLDAARFEEAAIGRLLECPDPRQITRIRAGVLGYRTRGDSALASLCRLFLMERAESRDALRRSLGSESVDVLLQARLVTEAGGSILPLVALRTAGRLRLISDLKSEHRDGRRDFVLGSGPMATMLCDMAVPGPHRRGLDLGCGNGVIACRLASQVEEVVATDLSARAVHFAGFNAALNDLPTVSARTGDLLAPVAGERFDLILSNPPMVLAPESTYLYRDGGSEICARIVREAPAHLTPGGCLQMLCNWPERAGANWRDAPAAWFEASGCDAWVLRLHSLDAVTYADSWLRQQPGAPPPTEADIACWADHLQAQGADAVGGGLLIMRPAQGRPPVTTLRDAPPIGADSGVAVARLMAAHACLAARGRDQALLDLRLRPAPELQFRETRVVREGGWQLLRHRLQLAQGLGFALHMDEELIAVLACLDGRRTVAEAVDAYASSNEADAASLLDRLPDAIRALLRLGMVAPV